jgi:nucleotide-binding universal stress UspA family protein
MGRIKMLKKIMVGLDKSQLSLAAMEKAIALAKAYGAELKLVHILTGYEPGAPQRVTYFDGYYYPAMSQPILEEYHRDWNKFVGDYRTWLDGQVETVSLTGLSLSSEMRLGDPGYELCALAEEWQADLIVLGSHGRSGLKEMMLGSVSNYAMHHAPCSVLISHGGQHKTLSKELKSKALASL